MLTLSFKIHLVQLHFTLKSIHDLTVQGSILQLFELGHFQAQNIADPLQNF